jgi:hypothetical protein
MRRIRAGTGDERRSSPAGDPGNAAAARVRLIVWCLDCRRQIEPDQSAR